MSAITWTVGANNAPFVATMRQTQAFAKRAAGQINTDLSGMQRGFSRAVKWAAGLTAAISLSALALKGVAGVKGAFDDGGALSDLASRTSIAVGELVILQQAFRNNGAAAEKIGPTINRLQKQIADAASGSKQARGVFSSLGLDWETLAKQTPLAQFSSVQRAIAGMGTDAARSQAAIKVFGKAGGEMLTLFRDSNAISDAKLQVGSLAAVMEANSGKFDAVSDKMAASGLKTQQFFAGIAEKLADPLLAILERFEGMDLVSDGRAAGGVILDIVQGLLIGWEGLQKGIAGVQSAMMAAAGAGSEIVNLIWDGWQRIGHGVWAVVQNLAWGANTFIADMTEGIVAIALDMQTALQYAFQNVVRFFDSHMGAVIDGIQAGLEFAIQKAMEGIAKIPILNKQLGLEGFEAQSFDSLREQYAGDRATREGEKLKSYAEMRGENFQNSGWMKDAMGFAADRRGAAAVNYQKVQEAGSAAMGDQKQAISSSTIQGFYQEAAARANRAMSGTPMQLSALKPKGQYGPETDAQLRKKSGVSDQYYAQLVGAYGGGKAGEKSAMDSLRSAGMIREGKAQQDQKAQASEKSEQDKNKTLEGTNTRLDDLIGIMEEAWL